MAGKPVHLDDGVLLAWIEGELSPERHLQVTRALGEQQALQARVDAMRLDRFTLSSMGDEKAPADLLDGVADLLEREMLVGGVALTGDLDSFVAHDDLPDTVEATPVVAKIGPSRRFSDLQIAMAAGLLLVVGASAWFGGMMFAGNKNTLPDPNPDTLAHNDESRPTNTSLAGQDPELIDSDRAAARSADGSPTILAETPTNALVELASVDHEITPAQAAELLASGRLVVRVRMADLSGLSWIEGVQDLRGVRIEHDIPAELASALEPRALPVFVDQAEAPVLAMDRNPVVGPPVAEIEHPAPPRRVVVEIVRVEMSTDAATLAEALRGLGNHEGIVEASFEDAGEALPNQLERPGVEEILWWRQSPERWTPKAMVPVVFEVLR